MLISFCKFSFDILRINFQLLPSGGCCGLYDGFGVGLFSSLLFGFSDFSQLISVVVLFAVNPIVPIMLSHFSYILLLFIVLI
ncbi:hypothetical protein [Spiroplasma citri]|uniref:hypothetical protein n=1 Tax=Spiroplasma citri TaxID=2133 RepID=UPI00286F27E1|nr:hypothetical protein [Spiroplasma citri]